MDTQVLDCKKQELELDDFIQSTSDHRGIKRALVVKWLKFRLKNRERWLSEELEPPRRERIRVKKKTYPLP